MTDVIVEIRNFRAHETLGEALPYDPLVPIPNAGDVVEVNELPYACHHRSFEYVNGRLARVYVMVEPDES